MNENDNANEYVNENASVNVNGSNKETVALT